MSACDRNLLQCMVQLGWTEAQFMRAHFQRDFTGFSYARLCEAEFYEIGSF